jgi:arsenite-transporting ATPase
VPDLAFFVGKGGVGKTTVSAAYALRAASRKSSKPVLLISTDPAHSLGDVLRTRLGKTPAYVKLAARRRLCVWELNSAALFREFLDEHRVELVETIESGSFFTREEIAELLETTLPGMAEIAALLAIQSAVDSRRYSKIVVDTAPFGHTLRLFSLPDQFLRLLNFLELAGERERVLAQHFGGRVGESKAKFVTEWRTRLRRLERLLMEAKLFLVTSPETFALNESVRAIAELRKSNPQVQVADIILNRAIRGESRCAVCRTRRKASRQAQGFLKRKFRGARIHLGEDPGFPIVGVRELRQFARHVFSGVPLARALVRPPKSPPSIRLTAVPWPALDTPLSLVVGKGGVGKTTVSAALGFCTRRGRRKAVEICSLDPAPSLDDIFQTQVGDQTRAVLGDKNFYASEFDSIALFQRWISALRAGIEEATSANFSGVHIDLSFERRLFSELLELVPPGVDEVLAVFRIVGLLEESSGKVIVMDMAPTGHALELLRTPERMLAWSRLLLKSLAVRRKLALAREAAVKIAELEVRARELSDRLRNRKSAKVYLVVLPELLPDRETGRLVEQLDALELSVEAIVVNRVLLPGKAAACSRCRTQAEWQAEILARLKREFRGRKIYVVRNFDREIAGREGLDELTRNLWRMS